MVAAPPLLLHTYTTSCDQQNDDEESELDFLFESLDEVRLFLLDAFARSFTNAFAGASIIM